MKITKVFTRRSGNTFFRSDIDTPTFCKFGLASLVGDIYIRDAAEIKVTVSIKPFKGSTRIFWRLGMMGSKHTKCGAYAPLVNQYKWLDEHGLLYKTFYLRIKRLDK